MKIFKVTKTIHLNMFSQIKGSINMVNITTKNSILNILFMQWKLEI